MADKYNGYTNWETWNVMLWVGNDEKYYTRARDFMHNIKGDVDSGLVAAFFKVRMFPKGTPDMKSRKEMKVVNWDEVTNHLIEDHKNQ